MVNKPQPDSNRRTPAPCPPVTVYLTQVTPATLDHGVAVFLSAPGATHSRARGGLGTAITRLNVAKPRTTLADYMVGEEAGFGSVDIGLAGVA